MLTNRSDPIRCRLVVYAKAQKRRKNPNRRVMGRTSRSSMSMKASARERELWLMMASPELEAPNARQLVKLYARRMQIELAFRGLKSHRYGQALEDSLTRQGARLQVLLLASTLASFVSWLAWAANPPVSRIGSRPTGARASSIRQCALAAKHWSGDGHWTPYPYG